MKISKLRALLAGSLLWLVSFSSFAGAPEMLAKLQKMYPNIQFSAVNETPVEGIYEAVFGKEVLYIESSGTYAFPTMVNMVTKVNLGENKRNDLNRVDFNELPLADAIKTVRGNGKNRLVVFADPNCIYCKKLEANLEKLKDVTVYTFPVAILGPDSITKSQSVMCANGDKGKLWSSMMLDGAKPVEKNCGSAVVDRNIALFKKLGFQGTPAIVFPSGLSIKGFAEAPQLEEMLAKK